MNIVAVDDERPALRRLEKAIREAVPDCVLNVFSIGIDALAYAEENKVDVAFLDIEMSDMNGLTLAKNLKDIYGKTNIVFVTGFSEYALEAYSVAPSGYILKPVDTERILLELGRLRDPVLQFTKTQTQHDKRVFVKCFGNFTVFVDDEPLAISREKSKELLAYLVHRRGAFSRTAEIAAVLWEDEASSTNMRQVIFRLTKALKDAGIEDIIKRDWNNIAIDTEKISCDYYDFLESKIDGVNSYTGEYMNEYSWAEFVIGYLDKNKS